MQRYSWRLGALLLVSAQACGSSDDGKPDDPGGQEQATPILERELEARYTCSTKGVINYSPMAWSFGTGVLDALDGALVARVEATSSEFGYPGPPYTFVVGAVDEQGVLAEAHEVVGTDGAQVSDVALLSVPGASAVLVWVEGQALRYTFMNRAFITSAPLTLPSGMVTRGASPALAALSGNRIAVGYRDAANHARYMVIDQQGKTVVNPVALGKGEADAPPQLAVSDDGGSAMLWSAWLQGFDENNQRPPSEVFFARVDKDGKVLDEPVQLSHIGDAGHNSDTSFASSKVALIAREGGFLAAWAEGEWGDEPDPQGNGAGGYSVIRVVKLDAQGKIEGAPVQLSAKQDSVDDVEPGFVAFGDAIAVLWARGSHIYICGGCVPDHDVHALLIDPATLDPLSAVVKAGVEQGGLLHRHSAEQGGVIMSLLEVTFHTSSQPAFAAFRCQEK